MNLQVRAIQTYFSIYSVVAPKMAAFSSFKIFQKVRQKSIRPREALFFLIKRPNFRLIIKTNKLIILPWVIRPIRSYSWCTVGIQMQVVCQKYRINLLKKSVM